ncbi:hypothetical protein BDFG_08770 [Blastomyces dermatitidis ATCC 26199]|nr:hypothetical protein BDFG_08770 [Blastomyces dermatitidis ATCC 26199]
MEKKLPKRGAQKSCWGCASCKKRRVKVGLFALSAIDLAKNGHDPSNKSTTLTRDRYRYKLTALEYANRADVAFREVSALETLGISMALYVGSSHVGRSNLDWPSWSTCSLTRIVKHFLPPIPPELAIEGLLSLVKRVHVPVRLPEESLRGTTVRHAYKLASDQVKYTFMSVANNTPFKALFFTILAVGGRELTAAFQEREPLALFIMIFWAVLIHLSARSNVLWRVGNIG